MKTRDSPAFPYSNNINPAIQFRDIFGHPQIICLLKIWKEWIWHKDENFSGFSDDDKLRSVRLFVHALSRVRHTQRGANEPIEFFSIETAALVRNWPNFGEFLMNRCFCSFPLDFKNMILILRVQFQDLYRNQVL